MFSSPKDVIQLKYVELYIIWISCSILDGFVSTGYQDGLSIPITIVSLHDFLDAIVSNSVWFMTDTRTVRCRYNAVNFHPDPNKRHSIAIVVKIRHVYMKYVRELCLLHLHRRSGGV